MGGFLFNGCGVADKFKKIKALGEIYCPICQKNTSFHLEEVKRKVYIIFIPTFSYKTRYAVMCDNCEHGKIVPEQLKDQILSMSNMPGEIFEGEMSKQLESV